MHIYSQYSSAQLLLCLRDAQGVYRFLHIPGEPLYGVRVPLDTRLAVGPQILSKAAEIFHGHGIEPKALEWEARFLTQLPDPLRNVYLLTGEFSGDAPHLVSFPDLIAQVPKTRVRLPLLKALQVLAGTDREEIYAVEKE